MLYEAILQTIIRRNTHTPKDPTVFSSAFGESRDKATQWSAFKRRTSVGDGIKFFEVVDVIRTFLKPIYESIFNEDEFFGYWRSDMRTWE